MRRSSIAVALAVVIASCNRNTGGTTSENGAQALTAAARLDTCDSDTIRAKLVKQLAIAAMVRDTTLAFALCDSAAAIAQRIGNQRSTHRAEELRAEVLIGIRSSLALDYCRSLVAARDSVLHSGARARALEYVAKALFVSGDAKNMDHTLARAEALARASKDHQLLADILVDRMNASNNFGDPATTLARAKEALTLFDPVSDTTQYTRVLINSGNAWYIMGKVDSAIAYFRPALDLCLAHNDTMQALSAGLMLASMLTAKGELDQAMDMLNDNVLLARTAGRPDMLAVSTFQRGVLLKQARRGAEALAAFEETWKLCDSIGKRDLEAIAFGCRAIQWVDLGPTEATKAGFLGMDLYDSAIAVLGVALMEVERLGIAQWQGMFENSIGEALNHQERFAEAGSHLHRSLDIARATGDAQLEAYALESLGYTAQRTGRTAKARELYEQALTFLEQQDIPEHQALTLDRLHSVYALLGDKDKALDRLRRSKAITEKLYSDTLRTAISDLQARLDYRMRSYADSTAHANELREKDLITARAQVGEANAKTLSVIIGSIALLALGVVYAFHRVRQLRVRNEAAIAVAQASEQVAQEKLNASEARNMALRAQMQPHFINNTVGLVIARMRRKGEGTAEAAIGLLASFNTWIGRVLETSLLDKLPLREEFKSLSTYLELQRQRLTDRFTYEVRVHPAIDVDTITVPPLLLQPLLENAVKHGIAPLERPGRITLSADPAPQGVLLSVEDDGAGRISSAGSERIEGRERSVSMDNIREQLRLIAERTGKAAELRIIDLAQGTRVEVLLPL